MRKSIALIMMLGISSMTFAQHRGQHDPRKAAIRQTETMKDVLDLNEAQYASIKDINNRYADKAIEMRKDTTYGRDRSRDNFRTLRQERITQINTILTNEQQAEWKNYREQQREARRKQGSDYRERMKTTLALSADQESKLEKETKSFREKARSIHSDPTLPKQAKRDQLKVLKNDHETAVKQILTADQYEKWKTMKGKRGGREHKKR